LTAFLYVSPVQTMPPCDQTGVPGDDAFCHFHSSTISGFCVLDESADASERFASPVVQFLNPRVDLLRRRFHISKATSGAPR
jgi:hypothetical protein